MRPHIVYTIFRKEILEALRDRRTLFLMVGLPMLLYPLLIIGLTKLAENQEAAESARKSRIAVWGVLPGTLEQRLHTNERIEPSAWAGVPSALRRSLVEGTLKAPAPQPIELDAEEDTPQEPADRAKSDAKAPDRKEQETAVTQPARELILQRRFDAVVVVWPGFTQHVQDGTMATASILYDSVRPASRKARDRLSDALRLYREQVLAEREKAHGFEGGFTRGVDLHVENVAPASRKAGALLGALLPYLLILLSLTSGFYAAVDLTAGEKERGTMQTLLCAPVEPIEIIGGKLLAVWSIAMLASVINLISLAATFTRIRAGSEFSLSVAPVNLLVAFLLLVPITLMVVGVFMAIGAFAKDFKEGQNYLTPVLMTLIVPLAVTMTPGIELNAHLVFVPVVNIALFIKSVFLAEWHGEHLFLVLVSSFCYALLALVFAARVFERSHVLLGGKEGLGSVFDFSRHPGARPTPGVAVLLFAVVLVVAFYGSLALEKQGFATTLAVVEYGFFLLPTLALVYAKGYAWNDVLSLRPPPWRGVVGAVLIGLSGWAVAAGVFMRLLPPPESLVKGLEKALLLKHDQAPLWLALLLVSFSPALCEELLFRGVMLSGFVRLGKWPAIGLTALLFGVAHASIYRLMPTMFLGFVLGYVLWQTRSIAASIIVHALNNGLVVVLARSPGLVNALGLGDGRVIPWPVVGGAAVVLGAGIAILLKGPQVAFSKNGSP